MLYYRGISFSEDCIRRFLGHREREVKLTHEINNLEKSAVSLTVTVSQKDVAEMYETTMSKYTKNMMMPGFRKGHVPQSVIERKYGQAIKEATAMDIVEKSLQEILSDEKMEDARPIGYSQPSLKAVPPLDTDKDMTYTVTYDVFPKVVIEDLKGVEIKEAAVSVADSDIDKALERLRERNALVVDKKDDSKVEKGDVITINYAELNEDGGEVAGTRREDFTFTVGSGQNLYKIDDEIIGFSKGETRSIVKKFADDYEDKRIAGKSVTLSVTVTAIKERQLPELDDDFAQDVKDSYKTISDLRSGIRRELEMSMEDKVLALKREELLKILIDKYPFDIPQSMLNMELNGHWDLMAQQYGTTPDQMEKMMAAAGQSKEQVLKDWESESTATLKKQIIVESLVRSRNVSVLPEEVEAEYKRMAENNDAEVEDIKKYYEEPKTKEYLIDSIKERKMFEMLFKEVKVVKGDKMTLEELMKK